MVDNDQEAKQRARGLVEKRHRLQKNILKIGGPNVPSKGNHRDAWQLHVVGDEAYARAKSLQAATQALVATLDLQQVLARILTELCRVVPYDSATVQQLHGDELVIVGGYGFPDMDELLGLRFDLSSKDTPNAEVIRTGAPLVLQDAPLEYQGFNHEPHLQAGIRSWLGVPLLLDDRPIGMLALDKKEAAFYTTADAQIAQAFAQQAAIAIENARLYEAEQRRAAEAAAISQVVQALNAATDLNRVFRVITEELHRIVDFDHLSIAFQSDADHAVVHTFLGPEGVPSEPPTTIPITATTAAAHVMAGEPHLTPDLASEIDRPADRALYDAGLRSRLNLPLVLGKTVIGALNLASTRPGAFSPDDLPLLVQVADAVASTLQTVRLYEEILQRNRELALLNRIIAACAAGQETESILETACRELALAFKVPHSAAALFDQEKRQAEVVAEYSAEGGTPLVGTRVPIDGNLAIGYLFEHKTPLVVRDVADDPRLESVRANLQRRGTISMLVLPLMVEDQVVGTLEIDTGERRSFSPQEVGVAGRVAEQVSGSLARARLIETQRRLGTAVEQAAEAVVITDTRGCALYVNPAFERISGQRQADVIGCDPATWIGEQSAETPYTDLWPAATAGEPWTSRLTNARPDGSLYTVDLTVTPLRNESGEIVNYVATLRDVTREVQLEEQFHQAQKMEALGQLAGGIAHDFNNLLTVIHLSTQLLRRRLHPKDPLAEHVKRIEETGIRATKLTQQLLRFSRREIVEPALVDMSQVVNELGNMLQRIIGEDIQLKTNLTRNLWQVQADPSQIDQVILNLVVNARDAMPNGGILTIETSNVILDQEYAAIHVDAEPGRYALLSISDSGIGMDERVRAHLFEPFFTTKEPGQGTGLGLATVFGIIKQNLGHIRVHSQLGMGTTFNLYLPCAAEATERTEPAAPGPRPSFSKHLAHGSETVLIVEDKPDVLKLAIDVLKSCGYCVLAATDGLDALRLCQEYEGPIDLLLTDVVMPYLNGTELAEQFTSQRSETRVLFMSGYADDSVLGLPASEASALLLRKPFTVNELTDKVRWVLDRKR